MNYYENLPKCSKCGLKTRRSYKPKTNAFNAHIVYCEPDECEAPPKCHAAVGIGTATLGIDCYLPEGHLRNNIPHSYIHSGDRINICRYHPNGGCP